MIDQSPRLARAAVILLVLVSAATLSSGQEEGYAGTELCSVCHEETVEAFRMTPHATAHDWNAEQGCEACHGPAEAHADSGDPDACHGAGQFSPG
jgi:hypothetical protein